MGHGEPILREASVKMEEFLRGCVPDFQTQAMSKRILVLPWAIWVEGSHNRRTARTQRGSILVDHFCQERRIKDV